MSEIIETKFTENPGTPTVKDIITIKQLPVMEERFKEKYDEIKSKLSFLETLEVSEDTKNEVKKTLADFRKEFNIFEERRKQVKAEINKPYDELNKLYKDYIEDPYQTAFKNLDAKIKEIESKQKNKILDDALKFYDEYRTSIGLTFPEYERGGFIINLSTTMKNIKEQITKYLDGIKRDTESINTFENADDIMIEYRKVLDLSSAIKIVNDRIKAKQQYETEKVKSAEIEEQQTLLEAKVDAVISQSEPEPEIKPAQEIAPPIEEDNKIYSTSFKVYGTKSELRKLKEFLINGGYKYEPASTNK